MITLTKVAWIREAGHPIGQPAPGHLNCRCGHAPVSKFDQSQGYVPCACGMVYTWDGYVVNTSTVAA